MRIKTKILSILMVAALLNACVTTKLYRPIPDDKPPSPKIKDVNIALVLGGGGARAYSHVGVLEVLEQNNIPIDLIVGTSAGSLVGALYSDSKDIEKVKSTIFRLKKWDLLEVSFIDALKGSVGLSGPVSGIKMQKFFYDNLSATNFDELKIPFIAVAVDIKEHKEYLLDSGPIAPAVVASSSLPPVFTPIEMYKHKLTDGGAIYPVPVEIARRYKPKMVISVDICAPPDKVEPSNMPALAYLAFSLSYTKLCRMQSKEADIDINPDTSGFGLFEDKKGREMYYKGREAALEALPLIKKEMRKRLGK